MKLLDSCSTTSVPKLNESLTVYLLLVNGSEIGTKYFASLYVGVCKANKFGLKDEKPSTHFLCTLQEPYIIPGLVLTGFTCLRVSLDMHHFLLTSPLQKRSKCALTIFLETATMFMIFSNQRVVLYI